MAASTVPDGQFGNSPDSVLELVSGASPVRTDSIYAGHSVSSSPGSPFRLSATTLSSQRLRDPTTVGSVAIA